MIETTNQYIYRKLSQKFSPKKIGGVQALSEPRMSCRNFEDSSVRTWSGVFPPPSPPPPFGSMELAVESTSGAVQPCEAMRSPEFLIGVSGWPIFLVNSTQTNITIK